MLMHSVAHLQVVDVSQMIQERMQKIERLKYSLGLQKVSRNPEKKHKNTTSLKSYYFSQDCISLNDVNVQSELLPQRGAREPEDLLCPCKRNGEEPQSSDLRC